uniref:Uncharacterized protein n=1 Tax=Arundo donax TaxID=35708 RepID=A0A0A9C6R9_ARUDO
MCRPRHREGRTADPCPCGEVR